MNFSFRRLSGRSCIAAMLAATALAIQPPAAASEFSVTPIRAELKPGAMSETITVTNDSATRLRVTVKLMEWTQDAAGKDVYQESGDLVYFPRQMDVEPGAKRLVRVGAKTPAATAERAYRLFIEEVPEPSQATGPVAVTFYFRFGVPIFLPPAVPKPLPEALEPTLEKGRLSLVVRNAGNQNFRLNKLVVTDGAGYAQEIAGWYSLAGTSRTYVADIPREACRKASALSIKVEGEAISLERKLQVDPANCS
jgi:fimbrial chaperone protein